MITAPVPNAWKPWLEAGLALLYPDCCQLCGDHRATAAEGYVCGRCWSRSGGVRFIRAPFCSRCGLPFEGEISSEFECGNCRGQDLAFRSARAAVVASDLVLDVIHRYKYGRAVWFEAFLAGLLERQAKSELQAQDWDWIAPVPLFPVKEREREFNQAARLAARLGRATGIPVNERMLRRVRHTRTQTQLTRPERAANMRGAFAAGTVELRGARVVLVDDVLTTGATTSACAEALRAAGASDVCVWTVARGL